MFTNKLKFERIGFLATLDDAPFHSIKFMGNRSTKQAISQQLPIVGWREWIKLPDLGGKRIKAKVDTGARSSSLHASEIEEYDVDGERFARFFVHYSHRNTEKKVKVAAKVVDVRAVRSSSGESSDRPVVKTNIELLGQTWEVELTLADRKEMGFRMLLGREAIRGRFLVDSGNSYFGGRPKRKKRRPKNS